MADPRARRHQEETGYSAPPPRVEVLQVLAVVGGPVALLLDLQVKYALVQTWACKSHASAAVLHLVTVVTLLLAAGAGVLARRQWRAAGREDPKDLAGAEGRTRTMAAVALGLSALSVLVIVAMWLPHAFISPCQP